MNMGSDCANAKSMYHMLSANDTKVKVYLMSPILIGNASRVLRCVNTEEC